MITYIDHLWKGMYRYLKAFDRSSKMATRTGGWMYYRRRNIAVYIADMSTMDYRHKKTIKNNILHL